MYEFECKNCGKKWTILQNNGIEKQFCNRQCWREYNEKKRKAVEQQKRINGLTPPPTPEEQCKKCLYGSQIGSNWGCSYFEIMDSARHAIHPDGLPDECQEFEPRRRGRRSNHTELK